MKSVQESITRIKTAVDNNEKIVIYADYDADGIPGAVILSSLFDALKYTNYEVYFPHRHEEGYGIHIDALQKIKKDGTNLVITIDVGITAHEAAQWAHDHDLDMIITDHHEPLCNDDGSQHLPNAYLLVNPKQEGCSYPDPMLCGCAVIYKVIQAFLNTYREEYNIHEGWEKWMLDMVGLATISDMVPLTEENRVFSYFGMKVLRQSKRPGLRALIKDAGLQLTKLTEEDIAFSVTPKINAASRMSHPKEAFSTLRAATMVDAQVRSKQLTQLNNERKKIVASTIKEALGKLRKRDTHDIIVIGSPLWQAGILGLVASKLVEKYHCPVFVWSEEQRTIKGSCRSTENINLVELMTQATPDTFTQYGGHAAAGGFSCEKKEVHFLQERLDAAYQGYRKKHVKEDIKVLPIDMSLTLSDVSMNTYRELRRLAPFGQANPKPLFLFKNLVPIAVEQFGKQSNHIKLWFETNGIRIPAIKFFATKNSFQTTPEEGKAMDVIAHIEHSVFRGTSELRLHIIDILPCNS
jgi:single-stranded-DNA-specific exonuclease